MVKKASEKDLADVWKTKFNISMLERLDKVKVDILEQIKDKKYIEDETKREINEITAIMNTAGKELSNNVLIMCANELEEAMSPHYPFDFPDPLLISFFISQYKDAFRWAVGQHSQVWDKRMQDYATDMYRSRTHDSLDNLQQLIDEIKSEQKKNG